jgi:EmrB/QacA subfamily drug resistance transporter
MERKWWTLIVVSTATFMLLLDITIVNVAAPQIASDLKANFSDIQWVIDAYTLTLASLLLTAGALADLLGRRRVFSIGLLLFALASLLCALSPSALFLILARGVQGIGGAIMLSTGLALLAQDFHGRQRGIAFGIWGATAGAAVAIGPLIGGVFTEELGWSSIFYLNVPVGILAAMLAYTKVAESRNPEQTRIDWLGTITFSAALFMLVFAVIRGEAEGWGSTLIIGLFAGSVLLLVVFFAAQIIQDHSMLDVSLFRKPTFVGASLVAFALAASMFSMFLYLNIFLQASLGLSALEAGLRFLPITVLSFVVAAISGNLVTRMPVRFLLSGGLALVGGGLLMMRGINSTSHWTVLLAGSLVAGAGVGLVNPALASTAIAVVPPQRSGMASGINSTFRQLGTATGIAVLGVLFESKIASGLASKLAGSPLASHASAMAHALSAGAAPTVLRSIPSVRRAEVLDAIHSTFADATNRTLLIAAIVAFAGAICGLLLVNQRDFAAYRVPEAPQAGSSTLVDA